MNVVVVVVVVVVVAGLGARHHTGATAAMQNELLPTKQDGARHLRFVRMGPQDIMLHLDAFHIRVQSEVSVEKHPLSERKCFLPA